jgi:amino-acid N-acetyltransferase
VEVVPPSPAELPRVRSLLEACGLESADVAGGPEQRFLVAREGGAIVGCIGLEVHGPSGLLRSFAVAPAWRRHGLGAALHAAAVAMARAAGVRELYILTTTVRERALRDGFEDVARDEVPEAIREGSQFRGLCPASAACMRLRLE